MAYRKLRDSLRGVGFTLPTPFTEGASNVYHETLREHVRFLADAGAELLIPCGNTGEYYSLSHAERVDVVETTVEESVPDQRVIAGAAGSTKTVLDLIDAYERIGVDGVMVLHPDHTYRHEDGLRRYYRTIAEETDLGVLLYKRGRGVTDDVLVDIADLENVVGVKYAVNDIDAFSECVRRADPETVWTTGIAERFAPSYALEGAEGFTTGVGNFAPGLALELMDALEREAWDRAKSIRNDVRPYEAFRDGTGKENSLPNANNVPAIKYGLELTGLYGGPVRPPLVDLTDTQRERVQELYRRMTAPTER